MGGPRIHSRGIDERGNAANFVECEQIFIKRSLSEGDDLLHVDIYSYVQIRGSIPLFWS